VYRFLAPGATTAPAKTGDEIERLIAARRHGVEILLPGP